MNDIIRDNSNENQLTKVSEQRSSEMPGGPSQFETVLIADLKPHDKRARKHSKQQIRKIAACIQEFGFIGAIVIDGDNNVVSGHARVAALALLEMASVNAIRIEHLSEAQIRAYMLADNRLAEDASWDKQALKREFEFLISLDYDLGLTGFEVPEVDLIIQDTVSVSPDENDEVEALLNSMPVSKLGDLWFLGDHKLLCGNALMAGDYATLMGGQKAQLCFTDPPYNVKVDGHVCGQGKVKHAEFAMASGEMTREEFIDFLKVACTNLAENSADGAISFVCMDWRHIEELITAARGIYSELKNICVWAKDNGGMGSFYRSQHEFVAVFKYGTAPHINNILLGKHGRYRTNVWNYAGQNTFHAERASELASHPTVKPIQLVADAILDCSKREGIVLDPFGGSGTTLLAAEKTGRHARLLELDPLYVDLTIRRWQQLTGQAAVHARTGVNFQDVAGESSHD